MKLLLLGPYGEDRLALLQGKVTSDWTMAVHDRAGDGPALADAMADADAMLAMRYSADLPPAPKLKLVQLPGAGYDLIDFRALPPGAAVCNVHEHELGISEYVLAAMLEWVTRFSRMNAHLRQGDWQDSLLHNGRQHDELFGKTVGIIGYGHIGREVARRAKAFDTRVIAVTRSPDKRDGKVDWIAGTDRLDDLLGEADFVVVACPMDDTTRGLIDAARLSAMKPDGVLINVARGEVVVEEALYAACRDRTIGGAVIDVWYRYPSEEGEILLPSKNPFQELDNVYMTPHASGWTGGLWARRFSVIAENLDRLARGDELLNLVRAPAQVM
jgi:phosphoglycerate dehydrogenase-like enzyme